mmetsp:Transcript_55006/g.91623  ORF Transcript_55006/g.91623 Transcript_55006/m.91623 type:complete len:83 (+) Transcript_55006:551-799(+)
MSTIRNTTEASTRPISTSRFPILQCLQKALQAGPELGRLGLGPGPERASRRTAPGCPLALREPLGPEVRELVGPVLARHRPQ